MKLGWYIAHININLSWKFYQYHLVNISFIVETLTCIINLTSCIFFTFLSWTHFIFPSYLETCHAPPSITSTFPSFHSAFSFPSYVLFLFFFIFLQPLSNLWNNSSSSITTVVSRMDFLPPISSPSPNVLLKIALMVIVI